MTLTATAPRITVASPVFVLAPENTFAKLFFTLAPYNPIWSRTGHDTASVVIANASRTRTARITVQVEGENVVWAGTARGGEWYVTVPHNSGRVYGIAEAIQHISKEE